MTSRANRYGVRWMATWPHISLGVSAHVWPLKFAHVSLHLPIGVLILGCVGASEGVAIGVTVNDRASAKLDKALSRLSYEDWKRVGRIVNQPAIIDPPETFPPEGRSK